MRNTDLIKNKSPGINEYCFNIEHHKKHGDDVKANGKSVAWLPFWCDAGFIGHELLIIWLSGPEDETDEESAKTEGRGDKDKYENRQIF